MADEMWRRTIGWSIATDDINVLATVAIPRQVRATLKYAKFENTVPLANQTLNAWWQAVALVPGILTEAQMTPLISGGNFPAFMATLRPILVATKGWPDIGIPANAALIDTMVSAERDFGNLDEIRQRVTGLAILNKGPGSNASRGWSIVYTSFDETLTTIGFVILEIVLEWPKHTSLALKSEHIANMENQYD